MPIEGLEFMTSVQLKFLYSLAGAPATTKGRGQVHTRGHFRTGGHSAQRSAAAQCSGAVQRHSAASAAISRSLAARPVIFDGLIIYFIHCIVLPIIGHH